MKIINKIKNIIFLCRANKDISKVRSDAEYLIKFVQEWNKTKNSLERNLSCSIIKQLRLQNLYKVIDYSEAKKLYDEVIPIDLSIVKTGNYVTRIFEKDIVKGKRWCEYFFEGYYSLGVSIVHSEKYYESAKYFALGNHKEDWNNFNVLNKESSRSFRFATKEEILEFKNRQKKFKQIKKEIEVKQEDISKLYNEL